MKSWQAYTKWIKRNCAGTETEKDLVYWGNNLFANMIIYLFPFCVIALVPGLYLCIITKQVILAAIDILVVAVLAGVAFLPGISLHLRKIVFIGCVYILSCALLYFIGLMGGGLLYLLGACIFSILIFPDTSNYWPAWINLLICVLFGIAIVLRLLPWPAQKETSLGAWVAVSSDLLFLSFLSVALIPRLFHGLQDTLTKEKKLTETLNEKQQSLEEAMLMLEQKNKEAQQFAYVASHDLNEPLRMITSFMGMLKNKYGAQLDEKAHTYIDFALDGGKRIQRMISDLLEFSRSGRNDLVKELVSVEDILNEVKQNIYKLIEESHADIIVATPLPTLAAYKTDISRLLQNLLSNAIKFRETGLAPIIILSAKEQEHGWLFSVKDNGIGIEQEQFEKIFDIFTRLHSPKTYEGSGIGLAVCKKVVENNGGRIWVTSEEGEGSVFYFTLKK